MLAPVSDVELVDWAAATYDPANIPMFQGDPLRISGLGTAIRVFVFTRADGLNVIAIEGTHNQPGWILDFLALGMNAHQMKDHPALGWVHAGFYLATGLVMSKVEMVAARGPFVVTGHSLGAALALMIGAQLTINGMPPLKVGAFAPPRAGDDKFLRIATSMPTGIYRYRNDPVPLVPFTIAPDFPYVQASSMVQIGTSDHWIIDPTDHHITNYQNGVRIVAATPPAGAA